MGKTFFMKIHFEFELLFLPSLEPVTLNQLTERESERMDKDANFPKSIFSKVKQRNEFRLWM